MTTSMMTCSMRCARARAVPARERRRAATRAQAKDDEEVAKRWLTSTAASLVVLATPFAAHARLEGVNNPNLLPPGPAVPVLDVAGYLTPGDVKRLTNEVTSLERDTGVKLRVLAQAYPQTPGLAVKDYWNVDDDTVVFVADPGLGNILNFSVGGNLDLEVPPSFWTRLANKYGTKFYWSDKGEEASISAAVNAIDQCLREEPGRTKCSKIAEYVDFDAAASGDASNVNPGGGLFGLFGN
jgi:hypothetical protein|uniref:TPM domain-containing protein n=1 Tax=Ostreococcus mediterraneus TaxID=1486918 RepID=A0A7S1EP41_9CHLO